MKPEPLEVNPLTLPEELIGRDVRLRPETPADNPFLERLYIDVRWEEVLRTQWPEEVRIAFLRDQFRLQRLHYLKHYFDADFSVLTVEGEPAGRMYLHYSPDEIRIVDISLLSAFRGKGIGTAVYWFMGGPGVDPHYNGSAAEASAAAGAFSVASFFAAGAFLAVVF